MLTTKSMDQKKSLTTFCLICQQPYTKSQLPREIFVPVVFFMTGGNGARRILTVKKEETSSFQAADLATTVADMLIELYC